MNYSNSDNYAVQLWCAEKHLGIYIAAHLKVQQHKTENLKRTDGDEACRWWGQNLALQHESIDLGSTWLMEVV